MTSQGTSDRMGLFSYSYLLARQIQLALIVLLEKRSCVISDFACSFMFNKISDIEIYSNHLHRTE